MAYIKEYNIIDMNFNVIKIVEDSAGQINEIGFSRSNGPVYRNFLKNRLSDMQARKKDVQNRIRKLESELADLIAESKSIQNNMAELEHELLKV